MSSDPFDLPLQGRRLIEASAGTGKTYAITSLYVRLLLGRGIPKPLPVDQILALTFTVAATQELRGRIDQRLRDAREALATGKSADPFLRRLAQTSADPARERQLLTGALQLMDEAAIMTIHSFCSRVLSEESFEAGRLFDRAVAEDGASFALLASQDVFRSQLLQLAPLSRRVALGNWGTPEALLGMTGPLLKRPNVKVLPKPTELVLDEVSLTQLVKEAKQGWLDNDLPGIIRAANLHGRKLPMTRLAAMTAFCESDDLNPFADIWQAYSAASLEGAQKRGSSLPKHPVLELIDELCKHQGHYRETRVNLCHRFIDAMRERMQRLKAQQNTMTLDDLLTDLRDALRAHPPLAPRLAHRWPVILVDEFQDTDDIQTAIFDRIAAAPGHQALLTVGDPKQAIYQFRGADIYTYLNAQAQVAEPHRLSVNHRSTKALVRATNSLFKGRQVFDAEGDLEFDEVTAANALDQRLRIDGASPKPYQLLVTGLDTEPLPTLGGAQEALMEAAAEQVAELLNGAAKGKVTLGDKPLAAGSIAFLVRSRWDAAAAKQALGRRGIQSVYLTLDSVLLQDTAEDLKLVLQAALEPRQDSAIKAALATRLLQSDASEIAALSDDVQAQQRVFAEFQRYHDLWQRDGIGAMLMALVEQRDLANKWLGLPDGERQLTNLRHLLELLQTRASAAPGMHRLLKWLVREQQAADEGPAAAERQLRLESDEHLVKIATMHAAKGLEYDLVFIPSPFYTARSPGVPTLYHRRRDDAGPYELLADLEGGQVARAAAEAEAYAEEMRLLYVALTRARHLCFLGVPMVRNWSRLAGTAMADLLQLKDWKPDEAGVLKHLAKQLDKKLFEIIDCKPAVTPVRKAGQGKAKSAPLPPLPDIADSWRLHSFTSVESRLRTLSEADAAHPVVKPGYGDDDHASFAPRPAHPPPLYKPQAPAEYSSGAATPMYHSPALYKPQALGEYSAGAASDGGGSLSAASAIITQRTRFTFPRGQRIGIELHSWLEELDFTDASAHEGACQDLLARLGVADQPGWQPVVSAWLKDILATPLLDSFTLAALPKQDRVDELEFHFPVSSAPDFFKFIQAKDFLHNRDIPAATQLQGMMTGLIDLSFRHNGKYYIADYKSNHLGMGFGSYAPPALEAAVQDSLYDLQYLIYTVAFHRHLALTLPGYSYDAHFGGVFYLFIRGMDGATADTGVFFTRPDAALIEALDSKLVGKKPGGAE